MSHANKTLNAGEDENFIRLIQIARDEPSFREQILPILKLDDFNRISLLNTIIQNARLNGAPEHFIQALSYLKDNAAAVRADYIISDVKLFENYLRKYCGNDGGRKGYYKKIFFVVSTVIILCIVIFNHFIDLSFDIVKADNLFHKRVEFVNKTSVDITDFSIECDQSIVRSGIVQAGQKKYVTISCQSNDSIIYKIYKDGVLLQGDLGIVYSFNSYLRKKYNFNIRFAGSPKFNQGTLSDPTYSIILY